MTDIVERLREWWPRNAVGFAMLTGLDAGAMLLHDGPIVLAVIVELTIIVCWVVTSSLLFYRACREAERS